MIAFSDIEAAAKLLRPVAHRTPLLSSRTFNMQNGNEVYFKAENFQRVGAFKFRGAYNKLASMTDGERARGVIAHSSGNHGQGVALSARLLGTKATIVMPHNSVKMKVDAARGYGADIVFCGTSANDREQTTQELIDKHGYVLVHPFNDERLIAGQGSLVLEIAQEIRDLDLLYVPIGGGGLISGCALAAKSIFPNIRVIGVETEGANDCYQSFRQKKIVSIEHADTIADGMRTRSVGPINFEMIMKYVDDVITIADSDIYPMMKFFLNYMKIVVEPTGAVAPAAVMKNASGMKGKRIAAVISGGNVAPDLLAKLLA